MKEKTKFLRLEIPESLHKVLKQLALDYGLPMNKLVADWAQKAINERNAIKSQENMK